MTKTACGPFFDVAPVNAPKYPVQWAEGCLEFTDGVRQWLRSNTSVKYAVISSPFTQYVSPGSELLLRDGEIIRGEPHVLQHSLEKTLAELEQMGVTPVVFSPPPSNGVDLGRCLARADWMGWSLDGCNFSIEMLSPTTREIYGLLEPVRKKYRVVDLAGLVCRDGICSSHFDDTYVYRDGGHLSHEGSAVLGARSDFYRMIVDR